MLLGSEICAVQKNSDTARVEHIRKFFTVFTIKLLFTIVESFQIFFYQVRVSIEVDYLAFIYRRGLDHRPAKLENKKWELN